MRITGISKVVCSFVATLVLAVTAIGQNSGTSSKMSTDWRLYLDERRWIWHQYNHGNRSWRPGGGARGRDSQYNNRVRMVSWTLLCSTTG